MKLEAESIVVFGNVGSDAGYWVLGPDGKVHHVGGWNPETIKAFKNILSNYKVLQSAAGQLRPGEGIVGDSSPDPIPA